MEILWNYINSPNKTLDEKGFSLLQIASYLNYKSLIEFFLEKNEDPNYKLNNNTAIEYAFLRRNFECFDLLRAKTSKNSSWVLNLMKEKLDIELKNFKIEEIKENFNENIIEEAIENKRLGFLQIEKKNYKKAIEYFSKGILIDKFNAGLLVNRAFAYLKTKEYDFCMEDIQKAKNINANIPNIYLIEAEVFHLIGNANYSLISLWNGLVIFKDNKEINYSFEKCLRNLQPNYKPFN